MAQHARSHRQAWQTERTLIHAAGMTLSDGAPLFSLQTSMAWHSRPNNRSSQQWRKRVGHQCATAVLGTEGFEPIVKLRCHAPSRLPAQAAERGLPGDQETCAVWLCMVLPFRASHGCFIIARFLQSMGGLSIQSIMQSTAEVWRACQAYCVSPTRGKPTCELCPTLTRLVACSSLWPSTDTSYA